MNDKKTLTTTYRKLENFLFLIGIAPLRSFKKWDGATAWEYADTPELRLAVDMFRDLEAQLKELREGAAHE